MERNTSWPRPEFLSRYLRPDQTKAYTSWSSVSPEISREGDIKEPRTKASSSNSRASFLMYPYNSRRISIGATFHTELLDHLHDFQSVHLQQPDVFNHRRQTAALFTCCVSYHTLRPCRVCLPAEYWLEFNIAAQSITSWRRTRRAENAACCSSLQHALKCR